MYVQKLRISNCDFTPFNFSTSFHCLIPSPMKSQSTETLQTCRIKFGFCNSGKRVSESVIRMRNHGGLVGIRCEGLAQGQDGNNDAFYIRRCVELARKAVGCTSPNPMVGCVIVKDGKIVGEGFHPKAGQPHAEVFALRDAGDLAENGTAYVSLEPCNHYGRTPPCTEALINAKVKKVVVGMVDPNPIVASKGVDRLRDAGIDVTVGVEEDLCKKLNEAYIHQMQTGKPFVTLRYSLSINGNFSNDLGVESAELGGYYSQLLQEYDAIILSSSSVHKYSYPLSKEPKANQPLHVVVAKHAGPPIQVPLHASEAPPKVIIFTDRETDVETETAHQGIETVVLDNLNLIPILEYCKSRGLCSVLLDLRGNLSEYEEILAEGLDQKLVQKFVVEVLPVWGESKEETSSKAIKHLGHRLSLKNLTSRISGNSVLLEGYF